MVSMRNCMKSGLVKSELVDIEVVRKSDNDVY
jgi:hypothetical protein